MTSELFRDPLFQLLLRFGIDIAAMVFLVFGMYYRRYRDKELVTAAALFNMFVFAVLTILSSVEFSVAAGFGLFAILALFTLRSEQITKTEITYFFGSVAIAVICAVEGTTITFVAATLGLVLLGTYVFDHPRVLRSVDGIKITLDKIDAHALSDPAAMRTDLSSRLGVEVTFYQIVSFDYVNDMARIKVRVRKYTDAKLCFVEMKLKDKRGITVKKRLDYSIEKYGTLDESAWAHLRSSFGNLYHRAFNYALERVLEMSYQRITLVAKDGAERMTIDCKLRFSGSDRSCSIDDDTYIVEIKSANGRTGDTELIVVTERVPRFTRFTPAGAPLGQTEVPAPLDDRRNYRGSKGLESVAHHPRHGLLTAPESPLKADPEDRHTIYAGDRRWSFNRLFPDSRLKALAVLPDGNLVALERSRSESSKSVIASLRHVDLATCAEGKPCAATDLAVLPEARDNFEGMAHLGDRRFLLVTDHSAKDREGNTLMLLAPR